MEQADSVAMERGSCLELVLAHHGKVPLAPPVLIVGRADGMGFGDVAMIGQALMQAGVGPVEGVSFETLTTQLVDPLKLNLYRTTITLGALAWSFDVLRALTSVVRQTAFGGQLLCVEPANDCLSQGYFQITPTALQRFAEANELPVTANTLFTRPQPEGGVGLFFAARKRAGSTWERRPSPLPYTRG
ncbi:MAG TPA: hypothetical protein VN905_01375 [Candidatus Binatia bacterium]|nr:hypothetical protein [Candidatus Binatia bacterium]